MLLSDSGSLVPIPICFGHRSASIATRAAISVIEDRLTFAVRRKPSTPLRGRVFSQVLAEMASASANSATSALFTQARSLDPPSNLGFDDPPFHSARAFAVCEPTRACGEWPIDFNRFHVRIQRPIANVSPKAREFDGHAAIDRVLKRPNDHAFSFRSMRRLWL